MLIRLRRSSVDCCVSHSRAGCVSDLPGSVLPAGCGAGFQSFPLHCRAPLPHSLTVTVQGMVLNFWMCCFSLSTTLTLHFLSIASPRGALNCPLPVPPLPHCVSGTP